MIADDIAKGEKDDVITVEEVEGTETEVKVLEVMELFATNTEKWR